MKNLSSIFSTKPPKIHPMSWFEPPCTIQANISPNNLIQVGAFTGIYGGKIGHASIGRYCSIAPGVDIASDQHPIDWLSSSMIQYVPGLHNWDSWIKSENLDYLPPKKTFDSNSTVTIGNDVWIGQGAFIKSGVTINNGAIVAAHAVVVKDVPAYAIVAGNPAKIIKTRFSPGIVDRLIKSQWWQYSITSIPGLNFSDPAGCLDLIEDYASRGFIKPYNPEKITPDGNGNIPWN